MGLTPRAVVVRRPSELDELIAYHGTRGQAEFFLKTRGRSLEDLVRRDALVASALRDVSAALPIDWRRATVLRAELPRFLFTPEDVVVVVGQDGLVANVAKYIGAQPVVGVNADPERNPGVLLPFTPKGAVALIRRAADPAKLPVTELTMVEALVDDGQALTALNEIFVGPASHQTARYTLAAAAGRSERQASSGVIVGSGTGSTGWCRSAWQERHSRLALPRPDADELAWFVREAWPSPATGVELTEGMLDAASSLYLTVESDRLVAFGDGIEADALSLTWGQTVRLHQAARKLRLVV
jgi:hypothetical protein